MPASASRIQVGSGERRLLLLLSALVAFGPLSIDMYLPSLPAIAADLGASDAQVQRSISGFLVGFCVGMLFYGPLSDRFGRRPVLLAGIALYLFSSLACALADSAGQLVLLRVLQALGGGAASVLARAMVRDLYPLGEAARMLALMHMVTMLAPLAAPLLGGYLMLWAGWRALFVVLALFAGLCLLAVWRVAGAPRRQPGPGLSRLWAAARRPSRAGLRAVHGAGVRRDVRLHQRRALRVHRAFRRARGALRLVLRPEHPRRDARHLVQRAPGAPPRSAAAAAGRQPAGLRVRAVPPRLCGARRAGRVVGAGARAAVLRQRHRPARRQLHRQPAGVVSRTGRGGFGGGGVRAVRPRLPGQPGGRPGWRCPACCRWRW